MASEATASVALSRKQTAPAALTRYIRPISRHLRAMALPAGSLTGKMAAYHMGWSDRNGHATDLAPGKLIRPSLCLWSCEACGGDATSALGAAAALEWMHNFTLVHDDIQDEDRQRRNRETVWSIWGSAQGINAGDALHALAFRALGSDGQYPQRSLAVVRLIADAILIVVEGQCLDLELEGKPEISSRTYLRMVRAKTGALIGASLEAGAVMAGAPAPVANRLRSAGNLLGVAFQIRDDWLGTWGDPSHTGKSSSGDLGRHKMTYPVVAGYRAMREPERKELRELFRAGTPDSSDAIRALLERAGGPKQTSDAPQHFADKAIALVRACRLSRTALNEFSEVANYVANRSR